MRLRPASATRLLLRSLVDDGVGKAADLEERRNTAHRFAVAEANIAARPKAFVQVFRRAPPRDVVEVDQHVAAKHPVEPTLPPGLGPYHAVGGRIPHPSAEILDQTPSLAVQRHETTSAE